ncbi:Panacea domain-containing protein [Vibrio vulnificus]|uniref:Panacea domain-containing protein n=1 Tax=Vibrio vulnificus TaxID=672 RepID=UPI0028BC8E84|nr:DUF4065 domain-containing protein [Vibrio vulnificus]
MYSPTTIAALFTNIANEQGKKLTHMQLQKLTYIAHGFKLATTAGQTGLIVDNVNAWKFGPVIPSLYHALKGYGNRDVPPLYVSENVEPSDQGIVRAVYNTYGELDGVALSDLTHRHGTPWDQIWNGCNGRNQNSAVIPDQLISHYYTDYLSCGAANGL